MKRFRRLLTGLFLLLLVSELVLRFYYGFCDAVLIRQDPEFEYIAQPNQDRFRFRHKINYNSFSMRSAELNKKAFVILGFGDSVINGGNLTDQDSLATTKLSNAFTNIFSTPVQVLNISAGSWGPDNCAAYLNKYGDFGTKLILLIVSSHDAHDNMTFAKIVGTPDFPDHQYRLALVELFDRYLLPRIIKKEKNAELGINKNGIGFNKGFQALLDHSRKKSIPLVIYLHPEISELKTGKYNDQGQEIIAFAKENNIELIQELSSKMEEKNYRDNIHLNEKGQEKMAEILQNALRDTLSRLLTPQDILR